MNKVEVTLKSGKTIEVLPNEVAGLRKAKVLESVASEKKAAEKKAKEAKEAAAKAVAEKEAKEAKEASETKEEKDTGKTKEGPKGTITSANFKDNTKKA